MARERVGDRYDVTDVEAQLEEVEWLRRQCRALLDQRSRAFRLGYQTAREAMIDDEDLEHDDSAIADDLTELNDDASVFPDEEDADADDDSDDDEAIGAYDPDEFRLDDPDDLDDEDE